MYILRQFGKSPDMIPEKEVRLFSRHAADIYVERGTCIADEYDPKLFNTTEIGNFLIIVYNSFSFQFNCIYFNILVYK